MSEYDVYLNSIGYMLAKDGRGRLLPGAARQQIVDPFTQFLSRDEPYSRAPFRFGDGAGLTAQDGSQRYEWSHGMDARSGRLMMAPERREAGVPYYQQVVHTTSSQGYYEVIKAGSQQGIAERFLMPSGYTTIRSVAILVNRNDQIDYSGAGAFYVSVHLDDSGPKPKEPAEEYRSISIRNEGDQFMPFPDRWRNSDWFWLEVTFSADVVVGASNYFWISVYNTNTTQEIRWLEDYEAGTTATRAINASGTWGNGASNYPMYIKIGYKDGTNQFDSFPRCFQVYAGTDKIERMYAGTNYRVLTWDPTYGGGQWTESKTIGSRITQLLEFNEKLFAACGPDTDFWYSDGSAAGSTAWTQVSGQQSNAFAVHDNMLWKADYRNVNGSEDGTTWTGAAVSVGDPGTPVQAMVSHGGKLYAAKPEGIYEITYPDTYPTSGNPAANLLLDFQTERFPRMWLLDWHSGLYFPGAGGVYELKNGILRNLWEDKVDEGAIDSGAPVAGGGGIPGVLTFTRPRSWAPLYDKGPVAWAAACGTTRGILFARTNPHLNTSDILWYDGRNWYALRAVGDTATGTGEPLDLGEYCTACFVQDAGGGRGWMWFNEGMGISRMEWPTWTDDTNDDGSVEYQRYGSLTTPWFSLAQQSKEMLLAKVGLTSTLLGTPADAEIQYRTEVTASWSVLGTFDTSPYEELNFPAGTKARRVQFKFIFDNGVADTTSLIVEQLDLFYQVLPEQNKTHQLIISCSGDQALREAGVDERAASEVLADLKALVGLASFTYIDPLGASYTVRATALTAQIMDQLTGPGPEAFGVEAQVILNLLEV